MSENEVKLNVQEVERVMATLKDIKPRGFKSMDRVVGLVLFFENKLRERQNDTSPLPPMSDETQTEVT